ncbi:hypothetical protein KIN20_027155 [Parelaphostrongylus tenuis]|uniref:DUF4773 domain-containing protein n=1 Tax=Parelaphostrongylus tenuis TaxID=148309 RepID=A0AAD5QZ76_PARTN|nr:hypothetical protein KIN20_027155 [Parelaphostrongylus tenuis]
MKNSHNNQMKLATEQYRITILKSSIKEVCDILGSDNSCKCVRRQCACCVSIKIPDFRHIVCVNATYNPQTIGLDLSIGVDGHYITEEISVRNPPPICFAIPYMHEVAGVCLAFTNLTISKIERTLSGCVELEAELIHMRLCRVHLGCFVMPI